MRSPKNHRTTSLGEKKKQLFPVSFSLVSFVLRERESLLCSKSQTQSASQSLVYDSLLRRTESSPPVCVYIERSRLRDIFSPRGLLFFLPLAALLFWIFRVRAACGFDTYRGRRAWTRISYCHAGYFVSFVIPGFCGFWLVAAFIGSLFVFFVASFIVELIKTSEWTVIMVELIFIWEL